MILLAIPTTRAKIRETLSYTYVHLSGKATKPFPNLDTSSLNETQRKIVHIAQTEYANKPVSYDNSVLKYSEDNKEAWRADFTIWVIKEAGVPYSNPNSGHWRTPGVFTLREYYQSTDRYVVANSDYIPPLGDVAICVGDKTPDGRSRQYASIVLNVDKNNMVTIGDNERGRMRVSTQTLKGNSNGLVDFDTLLKQDGKYAKTN